MLFGVSAYAWFNIAVLVGPLLALFLVPGLRWTRYHSVRLAYVYLLVSVPFILLDGFSHARGWWSYNPAYVSAASIFGLPIEEVLFFFTVPFACIVVWLGISRRYIHKSLGNGAQGYLRVAIALLAAIVLYCSPKERTLVDVVLFAIVAMVIWLTKLAQDRRFWIWSLVVLGLFLVGNTILTALPVVMYNRHYGSAIRLGTIPVEDIFYNFSLLWLSLLVFRGKHS